MERAGPPSRRRAPTARSSRAAQDCDNDARRRSRGSARSLSLRRRRCRAVASVRYRCSPTRPSYVARRRFGALASLSRTASAAFDAAASIAPATPLFDAHGRGRGARGAQGDCEAPPALAREARRQLGAHTSRRARSARRGRGDRNERAGAAGAHLCRGVADPDADGTVRSATRSARSPGVPFADSLAARAPAARARSSGHDQRVARIRRPRRRAARTHAAGRRSEWAFYGARRGRRP